MRRFLRGQLRFRRGRLLALGAGIVVAAVSFTLLTAAAATSQLQVRGVVSKNFRSAYDVLVRPTHSMSSLESSQGLVQQNYLSQIFGGITLDQYAAVRTVPGVDVAAPIAMVGYVLQHGRITVPLPTSADPRARQLFRLRTTRITDRGLTSFQDADSYVYVTPRTLQDQGGGGAQTASTPGAFEIVESGRRVGVCPYDGAGGSVRGPFDPVGRQRVTCWSRQTGEFGRESSAGGSVRPHGEVTLPFPFLVAAVDPGQEARLAGVDRAVVAGRYLRVSDRPAPRGGDLEVPVLVSTRSYLDESAHVMVEDLGAAAAARVPAQQQTAAFTQLLKGARGTVVARQAGDADTAYQQAFRATDAGYFFDNFWTSGSIRYEQRAPLELAPRPVVNPASVWQGDSLDSAPLVASDVNFRSLVAHPADRSASHLQPTLRAVGRFDPERLPGFAAAYAAPLATYHAPVAAAADERSRRLLGGRDLLPNGNFGGYLTQPPLLLTTLASLPTFTSPTYFNGPTAAAAPISVIRVRVAGVRGPDRLSRERIRSVATAIKQRTGLDVDITVGASATNVRIDLPAGIAGRPALTLREGWVRKGVAVTILDAVDRKSVALFGLVLLVCGFFLLNSALAAVRFRRREIATLRCLGWSPGQVFAVVLGELALVGLAAGLVGTAIAAALVEAFSLQLPVARTLLVAPVAVVLAVVAGLLPAARAAHAQPLDALRPAAVTRSRPRPVLGLPGLAVRSLFRVPGRTLLGVTGLALSIAALSVLLAVSIAFRGQVAGSLLGAVVSVQVRTVDYVSVALAVLLGAMSVIDVLLVNQRERAGELATLITTGWSAGELTRLTAYEGLGLAVMGSAIGAAVGLGLAAALAVSALPTVAGAAALAALAGVAVVVGTLLVPLRALGRLAPAAVLAEEE